MYNSIFERQTYEKQNQFEGLNLNQVCQIFYCFIVFQITESFLKGKY